MTPARRRGVGILVVTALAISGFVLTKRSDLEGQLAEARAAAASLQSDLATAAGIGDDIDGELAAVRETASTYALLLRKRSEFTAALKGAASAFSRAQGKVDTADDRAAVTALQDDVRGERDDAGVVDDAVADVEAVTAAVTKEIAAYDEAERQRALAQARGTSTAARNVVASGSGYDRVRAALTRVGGGGIALQQYGGSCGGVTASACAAPSGVIYFTADVARWSDARLHWVMAHELAHIHQFRVWNTLVASAGYTSLFGGNIELLANCMAQQRGYPSGNVWCTGEQLSWSGAVWRGVVP